MERIFMKDFKIAGFSYYEGAYVFSDMKIGSVLEVVLDEENKHDDFAVELRFKGKKIGYIPRDENREIAVMLKAGYNVFEAVVQQLAPEEHPERQVRVGLFVIKKQEKK